jgi:hypothetical protein
MNFELTEAHTQQAAIIPGWLEYKIRTGGNNGIRPKILSVEEEFRPAFKRSIVSAYDEFFSS